MARPGSIALWLTHQSDKLNDRAALEFVRQAGCQQPARILFDLAAGHQPSPAIEPYVWTFDSRQMHSWGYPTIGNTLIPGHCHFPVLRFFAENPGFDRYWAVEYDVAYTGHWGSLLEAFESDDADLITMHLRRRRDEPGWYWWNTLLPPASTGGTVAEPLRGLLVMTRYSRASLQALHEAHCLGWQGHMEALVPTVLHHAGLKLSDLGGTGPFTPPARRGRYYSSFSCSVGGLRHIGTVRYRPARETPGLRRKFIYHPVKLIGNDPREPWRSRIRNRLLALRRHFAWRRQQVNRSRSEVSA